VVFIENNDYQNLPHCRSAQGASLITGVLEEDYRCFPSGDSVTIYAEREKFFSMTIAMRSAKHIKSLVIWFAGHGKFINYVATDTH
jgi:hypothetical protein